MAEKIIDRFPHGEVHIPPSKSISHRALICARLSELSGNSSRIQNIGSSEDISATKACLKMLDSAGKTPTIMDCGESGSTLRFLIPIAALYGGEYFFTGKRSLMSRPMDVYKELLGLKAVDGGFFLNNKLQSGKYSIPGNISSQFISGLLFALPLADGDSEIFLTTPLESSGYVHMTIKVMEAFGVAVTTREDGFFVPGNQKYASANYTVEGDFSQAAFFLGAQALGADVKITGLPENSIQGDSAIIGLMEKARSGNGFVADAREIPDLVPPLAALMCFLKGESRIINAGRLRFKESDRLNALSSELGGLGAAIRIEGDGLVIRGKEFLNGGSAFSHNDHRIAMSIALAAMRCKNPVRLRGWECVDKSYPQFWEDFERRCRDE